MRATMTQLTRKWNWSKACSPVPDIPQAYYLKTRININSSWEALAQRFALDKIDHARSEEEQKLHGHPGIIARIEGSSFGCTRIHMPDRSCWEGPLYGAVGPQEKSRGLIDGGQGGWVPEGVVREGNGGWRSPYGENPHMRCPPHRPADRFRYAFMEFRTALDRKRAHTQNELPISRNPGDCHLQLHFTTRHAFMEYSRDMK